MCRELICLASLVLVLSVASSTLADLVDHWKFDEGSGTTASNSVAGGIDGTINGATWVNDPTRGWVLSFDGINDVVNMVGYKGITGSASRSMSLWFKTDGSGGTGGNGRGLIGWGTPTGSGVRWELTINTQGAPRVPGALRINTSSGTRTCQTVVTDSTWHHVAVTLHDDGSPTSEEIHVYLDGVEESYSQTNAGVAVNTGSDTDVRVGLGARTDQYGYIKGLIDDVRIYDHALTEEEIWQSMKSTEPELAADPSPADGATDVPRDVSLSWTPGEYADKHDVYFGTNFDDVNDADRTNPLDVLVSENQVPTSYNPIGLLKFGQIYYWRVDEVNAPPDNTIFKGDIWNFTTEPAGYPVAGENIAATASSVHQAEMGPEKTIDGSGLDDNDLHSWEAADMWLSGAEPLGAWIQYEFDKVYKLHQMWVWNSNQVIEPLIGFGLKDVTIEYSTNGTDYTTLGTTHEFARAPGTGDYAHDTTVDFSGTAAKYVRLTATSSWGGLPQYGLSEVRFFYIPVRAKEPSPELGATDVDVEVTLGWRPGREAAQHDVYLSTDEQAVIDGNAPVTTVTEASYGPLSLDLAQTYYWKINEVNMAESPTTWEGDLWNFTTREFLVVDDFESYNDLDTGEPESNRIFLTWIDGWEVAANGSQVGYTAPPFCEQTIVHGGGQSMPLFYDNSGTARYSEAELTLSPAQDWSKHGVKALSLWFSGDPNNAAEQMYVKVNGSKVTYDGDADNLTRKPWQPWNIELASLGIDPQNVTKLSIGFGDDTSMTPGGSGMVFFDDISLYPYSRQLAAPAEPNAAGLVAHYEFEGNTSDSSGNGLHGTVMGNPTFVAGKVGQAISLRGLNDFVEITGYKGILGPNAVTVTTWINTSNITGTIVGWGANVDGQRFGFRINADRLRMEHQGGNVQGDTTVTDGRWHHVAVTVQENATISYPDVILYVDGIDDTRASADPDAFNLTADQDVRIGSRPSNNDRFFMGLLDDVRIYDCALTPEEIAWLAGRTKPFDKPF